MDKDFLQVLDTFRLITRRRKEERKKTHLETGIIAIITVFAVRNCRLVEDFADGNITITVETVSNFAFVALGIVIGESIACGALQAVAGGGWVEGAKRKMRGRKERARRR